MFPLNLFGRQNLVIMKSFYIIFVLSRVKCDYMIEISLSANRIIRFLVLLLLIYILLVSTMRWSCPIFLQFYISV